MKIKTDEEIDKITIDHANKVSDPDFPEWHGRYSSFKSGAKWMQSDLLESASEGFREYLNEDPHGDGRATRMDYLDHAQAQMVHEYWQACSLYHAKLIKEKDERIKDLEEEVKFLKSTNGRLEEARVCHLDSYQEAVKDIESLLFVRERLRNRLVSRRAFDVIDSVHNPIKAKYGLDKQESKV